MVVIFEILTGRSTNQADKRAGEVLLLKIFDSDTLTDLLIEIFTMKIAYMYLEQMNSFAKI